MNTADKYNSIRSSIPSHVKLVVVTKNHGIDRIMEVYNAGGRVFGENKVQELLSKYPQLPKDVEWHLIGHLQSNKVKYIAPFVSLIHSVDSLKLLKEINKEAAKNNRIIHCLLQVYIANESTKFGLDINELDGILNSEELKGFKNILITGLMGMATNTDDEAQIASEFASLKRYYDTYKDIKSENIQFSTLSMGMSSDYLLAIKNGSNLIRVGSSIFGSR
jgi:PLP dependent protein